MASWASHAAGWLIGLGLVVAAAGVVTAGASAAQPAKNEAAPASLPPASAVVTAPAEERQFDVSYREQNRVIVGRSYDWTDNLYWGAALFAFAAVSATMVATVWASYRHPRHPRGPAVRAG